jgi:ABC-2 type transport system ATP-binding protein
VHAIEAIGLAKTFGAGKKAVRALDGLDLAVPEGTVLGLLGPNGAGKTTAVRVLTTLLPADSGTATVLGHDVAEQPDEVRRQIGLSGQYAAVDENLTGRENLWMFGRLYGLPSSASRQRAGELLAQFDLAEAGDRVTKTYSGGMRRRLDLAGALIAHPRVLFLDEPTTGLDPKSRLDLWDVIRGRVREGATILLTTQYLEEADALADSIVVVDHGRVIAEGTSDELKAQVGGERIEVVVRHRDHLGQARDVLARVAGGEVTVDQHARLLTVPSRGGAGRLVNVIRDLDAIGVEIHDIGLRRPTLDDVFLTLTGHAAQPPAGSAGSDNDPSSADSRPAELSGRPA